MRGEFSKSLAPSPAPVGAQWTQWNWRVPFWLIRAAQCFWDKQEPLQQNKMFSNHRTNKQFARQFMRKEGMNNFRGILQGTSAVCQNRLPEGVCIWTEKFLPLLHKTPESIGLVLPALIFLQLPLLAAELGGTKANLESGTGKEVWVFFPYLPYCIWL